MFTSNQIEEIRKKLILQGKKDSSFNTAETLNGDETVAIVQQGQNKNVSVKTLKEIPEESVSYNNLTPSLRDLIGSGSGSITNNPDEEDLTKSGNVLKFKNREHNSSDAALGYKILRRNTTSGVSLLTQDMVNDANTIYEIRYGFDLNGQVITLKNGCTLLFNGGKINNGSIICNYTNILGINRFEDAGSAVIEGPFAKGLVMSVDDTIKWYDGTKWKKIESESVNITATAAARPSLVASAEVTVKDSKLNFTFGLPKGEQGPQGPQGPKGEQGEPGTAKDGKYTEFRFCTGTESTPNQLPFPTNRNPLGWTTTLPTVPRGRYLYMTAAVINSDETLYTGWSSPVRLSGEAGPQGIQGEQGEQGNDGRGITSIVRYFATSTQSNIFPIKYSTEVPTLSNTNSYLWSYDLITYTDGTTETTTPCIIGHYGKNGVAPNYKVYVYKQSDIIPVKPNSTSVSPSGWSASPNTTGQWWQCIGTVDGTTDKVTSWSEVLQLNGRDGTAQDGKYNEFRFCAGSLSTPEIANSIRSPLGWDLTPPTLNSGQYLYMTTATINPDNTLNGTWSYPVRISGEQGPIGFTGEKGDAGNDGRVIYPAGVFDIFTEYISDEYSAPYVYDESDGNYYFLDEQMTFVGNNLGNMYPAIDSRWKKLNNYQAVFSKIEPIGNGLIGSAVFQGDYVFSQQGINPSDSNSSTTSYTDFNPLCIYDGTFTPNILFNFKTGEGHLSAGKVKFKADGSGSIGTGDNLTWTKDGQVAYYGGCKPKVVEVSELDDMGTYEMFYTKNNIDTYGYSYYAVIYTHNGMSTYVGTLMLFSDNLNHVLTQVLFTHYLLNDDGTLSDNHNHDKLFIYYRNKAISSSSTWGKWSEYQQSYVQPLIDELTTKVEANTASLDEFNKSGYYIDDDEEIINLPNVSVGCSRTINIMAFSGSFEHFVIQLRRYNQEDLIIYGYASTDDSAVNGYKCTSVTSDVEYTPHNKGCNLITLTGIGMTGAHGDYVIWAVSEVFIGG